MPFADPEVRRAYYRERYRKRYAEDAEFRKAEAQRKAEWFQQPGVKEHRAEMLRKWRKRSTEI